MFVYEYTSKFWQAACRAAKTAAFADKSGIKSEELHRLVPTRSNSCEGRIMAPITTAEHARGFDEEKSTRSTLLTDSASDVQYHPRIDLEKAPSLHHDNETHVVEPLSFSNTRRVTESSVNSGHTDSTRKKLKFVRYIGVLFSFVAIVSAWGFVDIMIQIAAAGSQKHEAMYYAATFGASLVMMVIYVHTCDRDYSAESAMDMF